ncbi:DNA pilot protein VP2 [Microviridae Fen7895_21]|uniref:DNA pilot protein VP2 n=1 Tax=Microviridae Fen7895_21 TaxID=1655660 RepID=UPI00063D5383|nr:DNA pilot protein VP2 [Microviridae Fen7895_21]AKI26946.1 DNA pilot protein VP2 [Microviridae Fen7895_21]
MSDTLSVVAGAIPVVGSVVSGLINNANTNANNAANRQFQAQQQTDQNNYNTNMWMMQNAYNAPAAQMARDKAAGLNPNLVYGTADNSVATAAPMSVHNSYVAQPKQPIDGGAALTNGIKAFNDTRLGTAQTNNLQAQTTNTDEDTILKQMMAILDRVTADKTSAEIPTVQPLANAQIAQSNAAATSSLMNANTNSMLAGHSADLADANTQKAKAETSIAIQQNVADLALKSTTMQEAIARIGAIALNNAKTQAETDKVNNEIKVIQGSKEIQDLEMSMRLKGIMPHDAAPMRALQGIYNSLMTSQGNSATVADPTNVFKPHLLTH